MYRITNITPFSKLSKKETNIFSDLKNLALSQSTFNCRYGIRLSACLQVKHIKVYEC